MLSLKIVRKILSLAYSAPGIYNISKSFQFLSNQNEKIISCITFSFYCVPPQSRNGALLCVYLNNLLQVDPKLCQLAPCPK